MDVLVLGLGNILMRDDGVGVRVVHYLESTFQFSEKVKLLDGGTGAFFLLPFLEKAERVILIDAVKAGKNPGDIFEGSLKDINTYLMERLSLHEISLPDLLALLNLRGKVFDEFHIIGIEPEEISFGEALSDCVEAKLPLLVERVLHKLQQWGISYSLKERTPK
ncbi:MAG: HyaD/HybD family hydrogenase maturation endopeptidase [Caldimicrobium sp.]|nr:HyaD/HybD family hydrogenase maturation endopeptidase [Caldimicrobium sp.]MCX7613059.1 HyaD/HybD family hydrogenase maturation endopeptidase [Caldimicrobium sp.]MDW8182790.1 HyaD/HybD family hydrogenase maturation endopeptidase [Caldimicrobium sp.]